MKIVQEKGITLVTLAITIIIIIILATITIDITFGDNGLIKQADISKEMAANITSKEQENANSLEIEYANLMAEDSERTEVDVKSEIEIARDEGTIFDEATPLSDEHGNVVVVPDGFMIPKDSGVTVQEGVVIEDVNASGDEAVQGSQYVWIPVGEFTKDDGSTANITLGRYSFSDSTVTATQPELIQSAFYEFDRYRSK